MIGGRDDPWAKPDGFGVTANSAKPHTINIRIQAKDAIKKTRLIYFFYSQLCTKNNIKESLSILNVCQESAVFSPK